MSEFKYIIFDNGERKVPVIFGDDLVHADVAKALGRVGASVSAGFLTSIVISAHGASESLDLKTAEGDATLINTYSYCKGLETGQEPMLERLLKLKTAQILFDEVAP